MGLMLLCVAFQQSRNEQQERQPTGQRQGHIQMMMMNTGIMMVDAFVIVHVRNQYQSRFVSTTTKDIGRLSLHQQQQRITTTVLSASSSPDQINDGGSDLDLDSDAYQEKEMTGDTREAKEIVSSSSSSGTTNNFSQRVKEVARRIVTKPYRLALANPSAIGEVLIDASDAAVEEVQKEAITLLQQNLRTKQKQNQKNRETTTGTETNNNNTNNKDIQFIVDDAFAPMEEALREMETSLLTATQSLILAKQQSYKAFQEIQSAALEQQQQAENSVVVIEAEREAVIEKIREQREERTAAAAAAAAVENATTTTDTTTTTNSELEKLLNMDDLSALTFADIDYDSSEMAPPFLDPQSCLVADAGPIVRVEKAPDNSRRIFAGIDILGASADDVWDVLTNYHNLQNVIPNLVVNEVLELYDSTTPTSSTSSTDNNAADDNERDTDDPSLSEDVKCQRLSKQMKGSLLRQVGGAKVAGIQFSAKTTVEVREWPNGMPDFAHFTEAVWEGQTRDLTRLQEQYGPTRKCQRFVFPRPFAVSNLPTRDISMQSVVNDDGEFRLYQGVWRMQPLVGCCPPDTQAMRLTYAVEISPRMYLPVRLVEGRIVQDLCANLEAIRTAVSTTPSSSPSSSVVE